MKIFMLVTCVLAIATMVYTADFPTVQRYQNTVEIQQYLKNLKICRNELYLSYVPIPDLFEDYAVPLLNCLIYKTNLIDEQNILNSYHKFSRYLEDIILDKQKLQLARRQLDSCFNMVNQNGGADEKIIMQTIECYAPILPIVSPTFMEDL
ncbi:uncharacterized protein LOC126854219 [Cataglyphis hispanica]|uniref:uncharacterized protein LOC126854219 n=1 Tax=Cataglyphis hispanica TaxID=1086592 RepID=UPI00217F943D|nr:uncharacterized protein LOC126854219 [Cataglyphis hispanica]